MLDFLRRTGVQAPSKPSTPVELIPVSEDFARSMAVIYKLGAFGDIHESPHDEEVVTTIDGWSYPNKENGISLAS